MATATTKSTTKNRRQFVRIPSLCKIIAQKILFSAKADTETLGEARNIGAGGLLFVASSEYRKDDMFKVTIKLPRWKKQHPQFLRVYEDDISSSLTAVCQVTRSRTLPEGAYEIGAKFVNVYEDDMIGLKRFIEIEAERFGLTS